MDTDFKSRKQVNYEQMDSLLEFLQEHVDLAKGLTRGRRGKLHSLKLWNLCAKKLNPIKDGAMKDGKGWSKYWCDWKYRVRRKALELKVAKDNNQPVPDGIVPLARMEECILGLIGESAVDGVVIKCDPLAEGETEEEPVNNDNENNEDTPSANQYYEFQSKSSKGRKRRHSSEEFDLDGIEVSSAPVERKPRVGAAENEGAGDSDHNDDASAFLRLEKKNLENSRRMQESLQIISTEITRLVDVMSQIRDVLFDNRVNLLQK